MEALLSFWTHTEELANPGSREVQDGPIQPTPTRVEHSEVLYVCVTEDLLASGVLPRQPHADGIDASLLGDVMGENLPGSDEEIV